MDEIIDVVKDVVRETNKTYFFFNNCPRDVKVQVHHIGYGIRGVRLAELGHPWDMIPEEAQHCLKVLRFWNDYGLEATREAFGVSRCPLYRWQYRLRASRGDPIALQPKKPIPRRRRQPHWPKEVISAI